MKALRKESGFEDGITIDLLICGGYIPRSSVDA